MVTVGFDGTVTEAEWANIQMRQAEIGYRHGLWSGGAVSVGVGTRTVSVAALDLMITGIWHTTSAATTVTLDANAGTNRRIDYIVAEANWTTNAVTITKVTGVAAANPVAPALTQNAGVLWQMPLARVTVAGNATTIAAADIVQAGPGRKRTVPYTKQPNTDPTRGSATSWNYLGMHVLTDIGRPYFLQVFAAIRFNQTETAGSMRIRISDPDTNAVYGNGQTGSLNTGKDTAVISGQISETLTGSRRVQIECLPSDMGGGELIQIIETPVNHFTVLQIPA